MGKLKTLETLNVNNENQIKLFIFISIRKIWFSFIYTETYTGVVL